MPIAEVIAAIVMLAVDVIQAVQRAGADKAQQEEAMMQAVERMAELRERVKFGGIVG